MRTVSKITALLAMTALVLAGCGDDDETESESSATTESSVPTGDEETSSTTEQDGTGDDAENVPAERLAVLDGDLAGLNGETPVGAATLRLDGSELTVTVNVTELSPSLTHPQHLHIGGRNECPDESMAGDDDVITTAEGVPAYGEVKISLTETGDVTADSALAVDRFPKADANGELSYSRTFPLPESVTGEELADAVIVIHGISTLSGDPAAYDGDAKSSLDPALPLEATVPAACAPLDPTGGE